MAYPDLNEDDDFGFSLVSEDELRVKELELQQKIQEQSQVVKKVVEQMSETEATYAERLNGLRGMIMPLLINLSKDSDKSYIFWPDRTTKIKAFITKINHYVDGK